MPEDEQRIAILVDFENLAIGARDRGMRIDMGVVMDTLSERGRVVARRAYGDWTLFSDYRQNLVEQRIDLIDIPQRTGYSRKNAADIKLAVDALELAFSRDFLTTFVIASGDSDFTPLVLKLRELNKRVIGVGVEGSTSELLPGACDEFIFYGRLVGPGIATPDHGSAAEPESTDLAAVTRLVLNTVWGLQRSADGPVLSSMIKRAILRKDPAFSESDYGFRTWGELIHHVEDAGIVKLRSGSGEGDPVVEVIAGGGREEEAFDLLVSVVAELQQDNGAPPLSGLKDQMRKRDQNFSEKDFGYGGFLQFVKAARARGLIELEWDDDAEDYFLSLPE